MAHPIALESIELQLYTDEEIRRIGVVQVSNPSTYDRGLPKANGVNDPRMGVTDKALQCPTCGLTSTCNNHYGFIELEKPILRLGHIASTLCILRSVCWACSRPKFSVEGSKDGTFVDIRSIVARTLNGSKDRLRGISEACKNRYKCPWADCSAPQPVYSRVNKVFFGRCFRPKEDSLFSCDEERMFATKRLFPDEIQSILRHVPHDALRIMGYKPEVSHPQNYIFQVQLVPPPSIRPATSASSTEARMRGENDLTVALQDLVRSNNELAACIKSGDEDKITTAWDKLQIFAASVINQNSKKLLTFGGTSVIHVRAMGKRKTKVIKDRLTGKKGRLRGNLSGKRVDQAGRSVVGPDSCHDIFQLGVPSSIMRTLTFPEHVNALNIQQLQDAVIRGANKCRGALTVRHGNGETEEKVIHVSLLDEKGRMALASTLKPGFTVERHLRDGDWVLFNRQPSLHKASIMAFKAYETVGLQFKLPLPCTKPFNADFDGDEMNIHALQDYGAIAEAQEIMSVPHQMVTPQNNSVIISLVQDSIVGAYMMSRKDAFVNREQAMQLCMHIHYSTKADDYCEMPLRNPRSFADDLCNSLLPQPAILKAGSKGPFWTGKQILSWCLPSQLSLVKGINGGDVKSFQDILDEKVVVVRNGDIVCGRLCKQTVGNSSGGIVQALWKLLGPWSASKFVSDAQRVLMEWLRKDTVSISIRDCLSSCEKEVDDITSKAMGKVDELVSLDIPGPIREIRQTQILQETLRTVGATVLDSMDVNSGIATVVASGSKGNLMNIAQIAGIVGQQTINGSRIAFRKGPLGPRTLANFAPSDNSPEARGFVASSYIMGLQPSEFFFHQQAGREGVVATAVSTADTGYNQRRMVKNQESEVVGYDLSVRVSSNLIVQQHYGGDDYDGTMVERVKLPCLESGLEVLFCKSTPAAEKKRLEKALNMLRDLKMSLYGEQSSQEVCMPANFLRLLTSVKIGSAEKVGKKSKSNSLLAAILQTIHKSHESSLESDNVEELLFWKSRDWRKEDDPSLQARLCVSLQCTTKNLTQEDFLAEDEETLVESFHRMYLRGIVNPGEGVGAVGSSSIGEPSTQMTLNIFHYSGIAEKNVTLTGLPRFKQIINAVDTYETSNMRIFFNARGLGENPDAHKYNARSFSSRLVRTTLSQIVKTSSVIDSSLSPDMCTKLDFLSRASGNNGKLSKTLESRIQSVLPPDSKKSSLRLSTFAARYVLDKASVLSKQLGIDAIGHSLAAFVGSEGQVTWSAHWSTEWILLVHPPTWGGGDTDKLVTEAVHDALLEQASVNGIDSIKKAVPGMCGKERIIETEGSDLLEVAQMVEVDVLRTTTNNIQEVARILGVEAALCLMQSELHRVLSFDGSYVDPRHTWLLADTVARSGCINPLNRHKMEEIGGSLLQCASFEQTLDVLEHGAAFGKGDSLGGATEKLIVGQPVNVGTGSFTILHGADYEETPQGTFVAPLTMGDEFDETSFVKPLLSRVSKPAYESYVPSITSSAYKPALDLAEAECNADLAVASELIPLVLCMRQKAQQKTPVWIVCEVLPHEGSMSLEEFVDIEQQLDSYNGWISKPKQFTQHSVVQYTVGDKLIESTVTYCPSALKTSHKSTTKLSSSTTNLLEHFDAWMLSCHASTWTDVSIDSIPTSVTPQSLEIRQEKLYEKGAWMTRLSRVWKGSNIVEAETNQRLGSKSCSYSLSIELVRPWDLLEQRGSTDAAIAMSIVKHVTSCLFCIRE